MCKCDWCGHKFAINEWFAIAQPMPNQEGPSRNWALCHPCADVLIRAWRLGDVARQAGNPHRKDVGDFIDRGLILERLLKENGFEVIFSEE